MHSAGLEEGPEAYRTLKNRCKPRTAGTKRAVSTHVMYITLSGRVTEVEHQIRHFDDLVSRYGGMVGLACPTISKSRRCSMFSPTICAIAWS